MVDLPVLDLGNDPFERGLIHGRELGAVFMTMEEAAREARTEFFS
jgi:hypothetical protein